MPEGSQRWQARRRQQPEQPWLWRDDWAEREIIWKALGIKTLWIFAIVFNGLVGLFAWVTPSEQLHEAEPAALAAMALFPFVGLVLFAWAIRRTLRGRDYGRFALEIATLPATPGGQLRGSIEASCGGPPKGGFDVHLVCLRNKVISKRKTTGSGSTARTTASWPLWQDAYNTPALPSGIRRGAVTIPVHFDIPNDVQETSRDLAAPYYSLLRLRDGSASISRSLRSAAGLPAVGTEWVSWQLTIRSSLPSELSACRFDIPVFMAPAAESQRTMQPSFETRPPSFSSVGPLRFEPLLSGGTQIVFPPRKEIGWALLITLGMAIGASSVAWSSVRFREPASMFALVALVFAGLFAAAVLRSVKRVRICDGELSITLGRWGLSRTKRFRTDQIASIDTDELYGEDEGATFACAIRTKDGTKFRFDSTISSDREVETFLEEVRNRAGLRAEADRRTNDER